MLFRSKHPDYYEVINANLALAVKDKPHLSEAIENSSNKALLAYEIAKTAQTISSPQASNKAKKIVENAKKPGSLSQVGGNSGISSADYYANMSDEEFDKIASKNLGDI